MKTASTFKVLSLILAITLLLSMLTSCPIIETITSSSSHSTTGTWYNTTSTTTRPTGSTTTTTTTTTTTVKPAGSTTTTTTTTTTRPSTTTTTVKPSGTTTTTTTTIMGGGQDGPGCLANHLDVDNNGYCDNCQLDVIETIDFYNFNDLHGKFEDGDNHPGVDEMTTYLENRMNIDEHVVLLSTGDMWQGGPASNETKGKIIVDWMNYLGFEAMALGNHEFDWGTDIIEDNSQIAEFPFLAINIYDNSTGQRVEYCQPSVMVERGGAQIGIIGAIGDCYSSITSEMTKGVNFKVGSELTKLVKAESEKLRSEGADIIVYLLHDGTTYSELNASGYYDQSLSSGGYVDVVFEGHTHSYYIFDDTYGVTHLQGGGDNSKGATHIEIDVNFANGNITVNTKDYANNSACSSLPDSPIVQELLDKYWDEIGWLYDSLGYNAYTRQSSTISNTVAKLYYEAGIAKWGDKYDIVLAGGKIDTRSPYKVYSGYVQYADLQTILPFDNPLYLCKIKGSDLKTKFLNNSGYYKYSTITASEVNDNQYYYIVADSYTALYAWAKCTAIEMYDESTFARDLLAEYIKAGNWSK